MSDASSFCVAYAHGFCCSYSEVQTYERSAVITKGTDIPNHTPNQFVQCIADNVDHNVRTINGMNNLYDMGMISIIAN